MYFVKISVIILSQKITLFEVSLSKYYYLFLTNCGYGFIKFIVMKHSLFYKNADSCFEV